MSNLENVLDSYFRWGNDRLNAKEFIIQHLSQRKLPDSCIQGVIAYLSKVEKSAPDIDDAVNKANKSMDNIVGCSKLPCECLCRLELSGLILPDYELHK